MPENPSAPIAESFADMAVLRHMALHLPNREQPTERSIRGRCLKTGWDVDCLAQVLCGEQDALAL